MKERLAEHFIEIKGLEILFKMIENYPIDCRIQSLRIFSSIISLQQYEKIHSNLSLKEQMKLVFLGFKDIHIYRDREINENCNDKNGRYSISPKWKIRKVKLKRRYSMNNIQGFKKKINFGGITGLNIKLR